MQKILAPGMQDAQEADLGAEMAEVCRNLQQGFGASAEQKIIEELLVLQRQRRQLVRQGKDQMEVTHRQEFLLAGSKPLLPRGRLTLGAVSIPAGVVRDGLIAAARTLVTMSTQGSGATTYEGKKNFQVDPVNPAAVVFDEAMALGANDIGHLQGRPAHFFCSLRDRFTSSRAEISSRSRGLGTACKCFCDRCRYTRVCSSLEWPSKN